MGPELVALRCAGHSVASQLRIGVKLLLIKGRVDLQPSFLLLSQSAGVCYSFL